MNGQMIQSRNGTVHLIERAYMDQAGRRLYVACRVVTGTVITDATVTCKLCAKRIA